MNPWWPCTETKKERALSSLLHTRSHTHRHSAKQRLREMDNRTSRKGTGAGRAGGGKEGCPGGGGG